MTDNPESAESAQEQAGTPKPETSQQKPDSPPSGVPDVDTLVNAILEHPSFQKQTQSVKDKRIAEIQNNLGEQGEQLARLANQLGVDPAKVQEAQRSIDMEDMLEAFRSGKFAPPRVPDAPSQGSGMDLDKATTAILKQFNISPDESDVKDFLRNVEGSTPDAVLAQVSYYAANRANRPRATAADAPPSPSGAAPTARKESEIVSEMQELQRKPTPENIKRSLELSKELAELEKRR